MDSEPEDCGAGVSGQRPLLISAGVSLETGIGGVEFVSGLDRGSPGTRHKGPYELGALAGQEPGGRLQHWPCACLLAELCLS